MADSQDQFWESRQTGWLLRAARRAKATGEVAIDNLLFMYWLVHYWCIVADWTYVYLGGTEVGMGLGMVCVTTNRASPDGLGLLAAVAKASTRTQPRSGGRYRTRRPPCTLSYNGVCELYVYN